MENYEVIGLNEASLPQYIAAIETVEEATKIQQSAKAVGWPHAAVFYAGARRYTREDLRWGNGGVLRNGPVRAKPPRVHV